MIRVYLDQQIGCQPYDNHYPGQSQRMLPSISVKSSTSSPPPSPPPTGNVNSHPVQSQGDSTDGTPRSSTQPSPTTNLTTEYALAFQTNSFNEVWSKIHGVDSGEDGHDHVQNEEGQEQLILEQVLQPNRQSVEEVLIHAKTNQLTRLVYSYFDLNENTSHLCVLIHQSLLRARDLYAPLYRLFDVLPEDGKFSQSHCDRASNLFLEFDCLENPFPCPDSHNFSEMRRCFSQLRQQLDRMLSKSRTRTRLFRNATMVSRVKQLDAAAKGTFVLYNHLDIIDRIVARLYAAVEHDKLVIGFGLERDGDKQPIQEVLKQLRKNHVNFLGQLIDLEEHICLCLAAVNRARSLLLREIDIHQSSNS